jgi:glycosyltransferase involved in cell wall biosynthesis
VTAPRSVVFVAPRLGGEGAAGGAETLIRALAEKAAEAGLDTALYTTCAVDHFTWANERPPGERRIGRLPIHFFPVDSGRNIPRFLQAQERLFRGCRSPDDEATWLKESVCSRALLEALRQRSWDRIVVGPYLFGLTVAIGREFPDRTILLPCLHDEPFARLSVFRSVFQSVAGLIFNSAPEQRLAARLYGIPLGKGRVVGMGLDPFDADPAAFAVRHGITQPYLIYSGRREPMKGTPLLLDYLAAFRSRTGRDIRLVLTGSGDPAIPPSLEGYVLDLGFVSEAVKREAMAGAAVFCHPSLYESFSIVLMESWMAGTPALVRASCEVLREHCEHSGGGLWFRHYPDFEECLLRLLDSAELRRAMGLTGREYVRREYAWPVIVGRLMEALAAFGP